VARLDQLAPPDRLSSSWHGAAVTTPRLRRRAMLTKPGDQRIWLAEFFASQTMRLSASTTHALEFSNDMSTEACCFMVVSPWRCGAGHSLLRDTIIVGDDHQPPNPAPLHHLDVW